MKCFMKASLQSYCQKTAVSMWSAVPTERYIPFGAVPEGMRLCIRAQGRQQVAVGTADRREFSGEARKTGEFGNSNLWFPNSCQDARQQAEPPPARVGSADRKSARNLADLKTLAASVYGGQRSSIGYAAAGGAGHCPVGVWGSAKRSGASPSRGGQRPPLSFPGKPGKPKNSGTRTYGSRIRVRMCGSQWVQAQSACRSTVSRPTQIVAPGTNSEGARSGLRRSSRPSLMRNLCATAANVSPGVRV